MTCAADQPPTGSPASELVGSRLARLPTSRPVHRRLHLPSSRTMPSPGEVLAT